MEKLKLNRNTLPRSYRDLLRKEAQTEINRRKSDAQVFYVILSQIVGNSEITLVTFTKKRLEFSLHTWASHLVLGY